MYNFQKETKMFVKFPFVDPSFDHSQPQFCGQFEREFHILKEGDSFTTSQARRNILFSSKTTDVCVYSNVKNK